MGWWKRWRAKHWDEIERPGDLNHPIPHMKHWETPRLRAAARRLAEQAEANPLGALAVLAGILGAIAAIISAVL